MREGLSVEQGSEETVAEWYSRYFEWRARRATGAETVEESRGRFKKWIAPKLGVRSMIDVTRDDLERFAAFLDQQVEKDVIASKTAVNIWGEVTVAFAFARYGKNKFGKNLALRVLPADPCDGAAGPELGPKRQKTFLRPDEVAKLLACEDVPRERRLVYAVAIYTGMRQAELRALRVGDVDLGARQITVARQLKNGIERLRTKTGRARLVQIEPNLLPLLEHLVINRKGTERLLEVHAHNRCAASLRQDLLTAGCSREALHVAKSDPMRVRIKFHNLRDSCLTHMAVRRDPPQDIQWRAGHTTSAMTETYIANARYEAGPNFGTPLAPLPTSLVGRAESEAVSQGSEVAGAVDSTTSSRRRGAWRARWRPRPSVRSSGGGHREDADPGTKPADEQRAVPAADGEPPTH